MKKPYYFVLIYYQSPKSVYSFSLMGALKVTFSLSCQFLTDFLSLCLKSIKPHALVILQVSVSLTGSLRACNKALGFFFSCSSVSRKFYSQSSWKTLRGRGRIFSSLQILLYREHARTLPSFPDFQLEGTAQTRLWSCLVLTKWLVANSCVSVITVSLRSLVPAPPYL